MLPLPNTSTFPPQTQPQTTYTPQMFQASKTYIQQGPYIPTTRPYYQQPPHTTQTPWHQPQLTWIDNTNSFQAPQLQNQQPYQNPPNPTDHNFAQSFSKGIKLEFPKIDGDNPAGWLRQAEKCFALAETPLHKRVKFAEVLLVGKADHWLRSIGINTNSLTWSEFVALINSRFAAETSLELIDSFCHMEQSTDLAA
jgi:hypothetical protein